MSIIYDGVHSIDFCNLSTPEGPCTNSWDDFHLVPVTRPFISRPEPQFQFVNIPLTNKRIDIVSSLSEGLTYNVSQGQMEFYVDHDRYDSSDENSKWSDIFRRVYKYFIGNKFEFQLHDLSPLKTYKGRLAVSTYTPDSNYSKMLITYNVFKYSICSPAFIRKALLREFIKLRLWLWNPFNFSTMTVPEAIEIEGNRRIIYNYSSESEIPYPGIGYKDITTGSESDYEMIVHDVKSIDKSTLLRDIRNRLRINYPSSTSTTTEGYSYLYTSLLYN